MEKFCISSDRPGGYGGMDLYYVNIEDDKIAGEITNMGPISILKKMKFFPSFFQINIFYSSNKGSSQKFNIYLATNKIYNRWENKF